MASDKVLTLTTENFEDEVLKSKMPVFVDFWAEWCGPCRAVSPIIDELASDFYGRVKVGKVDIEDQGDLATRYRIMSIPTMMIFKNGEIVEKIIGARPKNELSELIEKNI